MFSKIEISIWRAFFWPVANLVYWGLIFLSWWDTRFKVFLGVSIFEKFVALRLRNFSAVMDQLGELENQAHIAVANNGTMQSEFMMIPLVMAVVLFVVPFIVRRDHKGPVTGFVVLPAMTLLCYFFASFLNLIVVAAMSAGIHYLLFKVPGPDIGMFMVHPLYIIYPIFKSVPGFASQCLYMVFTATVLCTDSVAEYESDDEDDEELYTGGTEDDWDKSACLMEMDRLTRILNTKFDNPSFMERLRRDVASYVNRPSQVKSEVKLGLPHYKIILTETKNSLRGMLDEDPKTPKAPEAYVFIVDEMARMDYISPADAYTMRSSVGSPHPVKQPETETPQNSEPQQSPEAQQNTETQQNPETQDNPKESEAPAQLEPPPQPETGNKENN